MTEFKRFGNILKNGCSSGDASGFLLFRLLVRLRNLRKRNHNECNGKDAHCDHKSGSRLDERRILGDFTDEPTQNHRRKRRADRVERAAELHELVALVSATAQGVEERIDHKVQHAHRKACDERTGHIDGERADVSGKKLDAHASKADSDS